MTITKEYREELRKDGREIIEIRFTMPGEPEMGMYTIYSLQLREDPDIRFGEMIGTMLSETIQEGINKKYGGK